MKKILIADDEAHILRLIRIALQRHAGGPNVQVFEAPDGLTALRLAQEIEPDLIVLDVMMPGLTGVDCLRQIRAEPRLQATPIVLLSGLGSFDLNQVGFPVGPTTHIAKPFRPRQLIAQLEELLATGDAKPSGNAVRVASPDSSLEPQLLAYADDLSASLEDLRAAHQELRSAYLETIQALSSALEARDVETAGHCLRVTRITLELAREIGLPESDFLTLQFGAALHDVGKIAVPDAILQKAGKLTEDEWAVMRRHPELGEQMLQSIRFLRRAIPIISAHHERWDGGGYPHGLAGEAIPLGARIFSLADTIDAMLSDRPYRRGLPWDHVYAEVVRESGRQFDPQVVEAFQRRASSLEPGRLAPTGLDDLSLPQPERWSDVATAD